MYTSKFASENSSNRYWLAVGTIAYILSENAWAAWGEWHTLERTESHYRETRLYRYGSISLLEYQAICLGYNMALLLD